MTNCKQCALPTDRPKFCSVKCCKQFWYLSHSDSVHYNISDDFWKTKTGIGLRWEKFAAELLGATHNLFAGSDADLVWKGLLVDVKASNLYRRKEKSGKAVKNEQSGWWVFNRNKEKPIDFFLCVALIEDKPFRVFLIPSEFFPKKGAVIGWKSKYNKFIYQTIG